MQYQYNNIHAYMQYQYKNMFYNMQYNIIFMFTPSGSILSPFFGGRERGYSAPILRKILDVIALGIQIILQKKINF